MNQKALDKPMKRATFWMQKDSLEWLKAYAESCGISQGALINALLLDLQLRKLDMSQADEKKIARLRVYVDALLGLAPEISPAPAYRVAHHAIPRQFHNPTK